VTRLTLGIKDRFGLNVRFAPTADNAREMTVASSTLPVAVPTQSEHSRL